MRKSGVNLHLQEVGETYDGMYTGTVQIINMQVPLTFDLPSPHPHDEGVFSIPCWQVLVQAASGNTATVYVGNETQGCYVELPAGVAITIPINDVSKVYVRAASGTQVVNWIAMI